MFRHTRSGPYMDASVLRSEPNGLCSLQSDAISQVDAADDIPRSMRRDGYLSGSFDRCQDDLLASFVHPSRHHYPQRYGGLRRNVDDLVRKINQNASLTNASIDRVTRNTLIQPKVCNNGSYPFDFSTPMRLSNLMAMSENFLDRILDDYEIHSHESFDYATRERHMFRDRIPFASSEDRVRKLATLLNYLGARQIADVFRFDRDRVPPGSRLLLAANRRYGE